MLTVVFDASPLVAARKFETEGKLVIDHLLSGCRIVIAPSVEEEVAILGASYPNGVVAGERIVAGAIHVVPVAERRWTQHLADYALGDGERDSIELCGQTEEVEALVTDDYLAFVAAPRLALKVWMLPDLVVQLVERGALTPNLAEVILKVIRPRYYHLGVIEHSVGHLREVKQNAKGCRTDQRGDSAGCATPQGDGK